MPIPALDQQGLLPAGIHDCTLDEIKKAFGSFQQSDRRPRLFARLEMFLSEAKGAQLVASVVVDGSFITAKPEPTDIDLILELAAGHDFAADLSPAAYNVVLKQRVHRRFGFDLLVARENSVEYDRWTEFFQQVRLAPARRKGTVKVRL